MRTSRPNSTGPTAWRGVAAAVTALALAACGGSDDPQAAVAATGDALSIEEAWVKAGETGMTAAFGIFVNRGDRDIRVLSAETPASAAVELHEVVPVDGEMAMREVDDGFVVPAGGERVLEPGSDHLMLMGLTAAIEPGDDVDMVLTLEDGSTVAFTAQVKDFSGAGEEYVPGQAGDSAGEDHDE